MHLVIGCGRSSVRKVVSSAEIWRTFQGLIKFLGWNVLPLKNVSIFVNKCCFFVVKVVYCRMILMRISVEILFGSFLRHQYHWLLQLLWHIELLISRVVYERFHAQMTIYRHRLIICSVWTCCERIGQHHLIGHVVVISRRVNFDVKIVCNSLIPASKTLRTLPFHRIVKLFGMLGNWIAHLLISTRIHEQIVICSPRHWLIIWQSWEF